MLGPIFAREFVTVPRRQRHFLLRLSSLGLFWVIGVTAWQATVGFNRFASLGETARFGLLLFQILTYVQLTLLLFFSALSAASTVSQEKDRRTFVLLLLTDMRDYEIVLGKMLGSLLPIFFILLGTVPVLFMLLLLGGVSALQVVQGTLVLGATSIAAGSLGGLIALWREKTFQSLALAVLFLVLYLCVVQILGAVVPSIFQEVDGSILQSWIDPFLALQTVLEPPADGTTLVAPAYGFTFCMLVGCVLLNGFGIWKLRVWNPSGEPIQQRETPADVDEDSPELRAKAHAAPGTARQVGPNPISWREIKTYAYGRRPLLVKFAYGIVLALICYFAFSELGSVGQRPAFAAAYGLVPIVILSLLLVSAQAVTSITSERDGRALDLLLVTDLTPQEFVFGKIKGILFNTKEFLIPPLLVTLYYGFRGALANTPRDATFGEVLGINIGPMICVMGAIAVLLAFAVVFGLHVALRIENSRMAIGNTLGTMFFLCVGTLISIYLILINSGSLTNQLISFSAFIGLGIGGFWYVLSSDRPSTALTFASALCPIAMFYTVTNVLIAKPGSQESTDPLVPFLVISASFGFAIAAMLVPLLSEFDVALGRTRENEE